jgi:uncharacterized membrane protein YraQ (UPF0718 family)
MIDSLLLQLIEFVKSTAPLVWQIMMRQVTAVSISMIIGGIFLLVTSIALYKLGKKLRAASDYEDSPGYILAFLLSGTALLFSIILLISAFMRLYNPAYYAIQLLLQQVK